MTAVANTVYTAAQFNTHVRDNLLETAPAKATTAGSIFVATGANAIAERIISSATVATSQTTTSASFTDLATVGPAVTVTTGTSAIVVVTASLNNNTSGGGARVDFEVSGATSRAASDATALIHVTAAANQGHRASAITHVTGLTPGSNIFTMKYRIPPTGGGTATINDRHLIVIPL